ncbi:hypothetical protein [uncultured Endozoicomonas sp.]|uniref:hypothetical protein n=1 Tax=uncultured Endozoicomonas sp. TaxID=432652 RepID=UPI0026134EDA|nr:hypothetical protein [uncultured Endozoicomonas sp.]
MRSDGITGFHEFYYYPAVGVNAECNQAGEKESQSISFGSWLCQCILNVGCCLFSDSSGEYPTQGRLSQRNVMINNQPECRISTVSGQTSEHERVAAKNNSSYLNDGFDGAYEFL